ncbi:MAG TPA: hypothetical protein VF581_05440 [Flavobacterium sp.]|jgi:hypothetical protein
MKILYYIFLLCLSASSFAQIDTGKKKLSISPAPQPTTTVEAPKPAIKPFELPPSIKDPDATPSSSMLQKKNDFSMSKQNDFVNPGKRVEDKINRRGEGEQYKALRKNEYHGDYRTTSPYIIVHYRDFGEIDGDAVRLHNNDRVVVAEDYLGDSYDKVRIDLVEGFNKIDVEALNQGSLGPNTAEYQIYDAAGMLMTTNQWFLATGFKVIIIIVKE